MKGPFRDREREAYAERFREGQKMIARLNAEAGMTGLPDQD